MQDTRNEAIKALADEGWTVPELASWFRVSPAAINKILKREEMHAHQAS